MRHFSNMSEDSPVELIISVPETLASVSALPSPNIFPAGPLGLGINYSWPTWIADMFVTILKYANTPTANISVNITVAYAGPPLPSGYSSSLAYATYDPPAPAIPPLPAPLVQPAVGGHLIWDYSGSLTNSPNGTGPTGNGFNEIIFLRNRSVGNGGFCSMDFNAQTGAIIECDVVFDTQSFMSGSLLGLPNETTAFAHEIGHMFGLDHTNLHPGGFLANAPLPITPGYPRRSWMSYTGAALECPGMVGAVARFAGFDMVLNTPLHKDERAGLARIYPVQNPAYNKDPLINTTATIRGRLHNPPPGKVGRFGDNVFLIQRGLGMLGAASPPDTTNPFPGVGTISGTARIAITDVVGTADIVTSELSSGAFEIIGIPAAVPSGTVAGTQYDIIAEDLGFSGLTGGGTYGEWYYEPFMNPLKNLISPMLYQTRHYSNDGIYFTAPGPVVDPAWVGGPNPVVGSYSVVPGTIIDIGTITHTLAGFGSTADATSRPLVYIVERTRPPATGVVTLLSLSNFPVNLQTASLTVNGVPFNLALTGTGISLNTTTYPLVTLTIPANHAQFLPSIGTPARLVFTLSETGPPPLNSGLTFRAGINQVNY